MNRAEVFKSVVEKAGGKFITECFTFGRYHIVTILELQSDETMMSVMLARNGFILRLELLAA